MYSPTLDEFLKLAAQGNLIPVTRRILADLETPLSAYRKIRGQGESFLFESVEGGEHIGRYSFVGCNPRAVIQQTGNRRRSDRKRKSRRKFHRRARDVQGRPRSRRARDEKISRGGGSGPAAFHRRRGRLHRLRIYP